MSVNLRLTTPGDLEFVLATEQAEQGSGHIGQWSRQEHTNAVNSSHHAHLIIERIADQKPVGYVIVQDLDNPHQNIAVTRIVVTEKGQGYGRRALQLVKQMAFETYGAYRLWLDVKSYNPRAQALYQSEGFVVEGTLRDCVQLGPRHCRLQKQGQHRASLVIMSILRPEYTAMIGSISPSN